MGNLFSAPTIESVVEKAKESILSDADCRITLRFPGFQEGDKEFLENQRQISKLFESVPDLVDKFGSVCAPNGAGKLLELLQSKIFKSSDHYEKALGELKIDNKKIVDNAHAHLLVMAEMNQIERQLLSFQDPELAIEKKKTHLALADSACYQLLVKFRDPDFYLRKYPFVFAPFLVNFVALYLPIAQANLRFTTTNQKLKDTRKNMTDLSELVIYFSQESIRARQQYIKQALVDTSELETLLLLDGSKAVYSLMLYPHVQTYNAAFKIIIEWHRQQASEVFADYFDQPLKSIRDFRILLERELFLPSMKQNSNRMFVPIRFAAEIVIAKPNSNQNQL